MNIQKVDIEKVKLNPNNPRVIKDENFKKLVKSIKDFPKMLDIRPIVVNKDWIVLGGNMRLKACKDAGVKEIPIILADDLDEQQQREFIIKDNIGYGDWDWAVLSLEWEQAELADWGLETFETGELNVDDFFAEGEEQPQLNNKIILHFPEEVCENIKSILLRQGRTLEEGLINILEL